MADNSYRRLACPAIALPGAYGIVAFLSLMHMPVDAGAMGRILYLDEIGSISRCQIESLDPKFSSVDAQYRARGKCYVFEDYNRSKHHGDPPNIESTFASEKLAYIISWEAQAKYVPGTKTAEETISVMKRVRPDQDNFVSIGRINVTMRCDQDPWLQPHTQPCSMSYFGKDQSLNIYDLTGLYATNDAYPASSHLTSELRATLNSQQRWYLSLFQQPEQRISELHRADKGFRAKSSVGSVTGTQCNAGFVERLAGPGDNVCVTPESRERAKQENATAASRRNPRGPYGPNTCLTGFVWREAFGGDQICVTPEIRKLVKDENAMHASRSTGQTSPTQLMRPGTGLALPPTGLIHPRGVEDEPAEPAAESGR